MALQEQLFERLWEDTTLRIRNAGIAEISVNKQLENVQKVRACVRACCKLHVMQFSSL